MSEDVFSGVRSGYAIAQTVSRFFSVAIQILARPFAVVTQVFFRKDMGERYFTRNHAALGVCLIGLATLASRNLIPILRASGVDLWGRTTFGGYAMSPLIVTGIGIAWLFAFLIAYSRHTLAIKRRYKAGTRWHSYNSGVPRVPMLAPVTEYIVTACLAVIAAYENLYVYSGVLVVSLVCSIVTEWLAAERFWHAVLDAVDAEIESENLGRAIRERLKPKNAEGLETPVPTYVSPAARQKIAEALGMPPEPEVVVKRDLMSSEKPGNPVAASK